jgi:hypothetical protein
MNATATKKQDNHEGCPYKIQIPSCWSGTPLLLMIACIGVRHPDATIEKKDSHTGCPNKIERPSQAEACGLNQTVHS